MNDSILYWNDVLLQASRRDFTASFIASPQQGGPTRTSRAMAIVHLAIHDAVVGIAGGQTYLARKGAGIPAPGAPADVDAAVAAAALTTLNALYPAFAAFFTDRLGGAPIGSDAAQIAVGSMYGDSVATAILALRAGDGASSAMPYHTVNAYGRHAGDPYNPTAGHVTPGWGKVAHFALAGHEPQAPPPGYDEDDYTENSHYKQDFSEVRDFGSRQPIKRTPEQTVIGTFWGYDGAQQIGVPPRLYNQIVRAVSLKNGWGRAKNARVFALANVVMADAGIDAWHWKYFYDLWRPVVGIRQAAKSCGFYGMGGMSAVRTEGEALGDPFWAPLGLPRTNQVGAGPATPQFPAYPSGHATFGAALFQILQLESGKPAIGIGDVLKFAADNPGTGFDDTATTFSLVSDELDGKSIDADGSVRTRHVRRFKNFVLPIYENAVSRVFLGVHWRFDGLPRKADQGAIGGVPIGLEIGKKVAAFFA